MEKIKLYHYTDIKNLKKIDINFFNSHYYTENDYKSCRIKRIFFFIEKIPYENFFTSSKYCYIVEVNKNKIYDLRADKKNLLKKFRYTGLDVVNITALLNHVKSIGYFGVIYNINSKYDIVTLFKTQKITGCINNNAV